MVGIIYLLCFEKDGRKASLSHAGHYLGWCSGDLGGRLAEHRDGNGAKLPAVAVAAGLELRLVRVWEGSRKGERSLKSHHNTPRFCPLCNPKAYRCGVNPRS